MLMNSLGGTLGIISFTSFRAVATRCADAASAASGAGPSFCALDAKLSSLIEAAERFREPVEGKDFSLDIPPFFPPPSKLAMLLPSDSKEALRLSFLRLVGLMRGGAGGILLQTLLIRSLTM